MANTAALLQYKEVESGSGLTNIVCDTGCLRFWYRPRWTSQNAGGAGPGGNINQPLTVYLNTPGGTATSGADYTALPGSVTIASGASSAPVPVTPLDDSADESDETVGLSLAAHSAYTVGSPNSATVTIFDKPTVTVAATDPVAKESGLDPGAFTLSRQAGEFASPLTVNVTLGGNAGPGTDYQAITTPVTIPANQASVTVPVTPLDDSLDEPDETVVMTIQTSAGYNTGSPNSATVTILDKPTVSVAATDATAKENGLNPGVFTISRQAGDLTGALAVQVVLSGTAGNGIDYQTITTPVIIPANQASVTVTVTPLADSLLEPEETVILSLTANSAYNLGAVANATVNLQDKPPLPEPPTHQVLNVWHFSDTNWLSLRGGGPKTNYGLQLTQSSFDGNAVRVDSTAALLQYKEVESGSDLTNIVCDTGCLRFWFRPRWTSQNLGGTGPVNWGRLLEFGEVVQNIPAATGWWSLYFNGLGNTILFSAQTNGLQQVYLTAPVSLQSNQWYCFLLNYSATNSALYLNDQRIGTGTGVCYWPGASVRSFGFRIGGTDYGGNLIRGDIDYLVTGRGNFNAEWATNFNGYQAVAARYPLGPEGGSYQNPENPGAYVNNYGPDDLWLEVTPGNNAVTLTLHNTIAGRFYSILGAEQVTGPWAVQSTVLATSGENAPHVEIPRDGKPRYFWRAQEAELDPAGDSDGDGLPDSYELSVTHTNPTLADSDGDGLLDGWEAACGFNPLNSDSDGDGIGDAAEYTPVPGFQNRYEYDNLGRLLKVIGTRTREYRYDAEGNLELLP